MVVRCSFFVVRFVVLCLLFGVFFCCFLLVVCFLFVVCCLLVVGIWSSLLVCCLLFDVLWFVDVCLFICSCVVLSLFDDCCLLLV